MDETWLEMRDRYERQLVQVQEMRQSLKNVVVQVGRPMHLHKFMMEFLRIEEFRLTQRIKDYTQFAKDYSELLNVQNHHAS